MHFEEINDRIFCIKIRGRYRKITIVNVHAVTENAAEEKKYMFYMKILRKYTIYPNMI